MNYPDIPLTEKEIQSIQAYAGDKHTKINMIVDMQSEKYKELGNKGWNLNINSEELEELIEEFINIYSAIYKKGNITRSGRLYRGTTNKDARNLRKHTELENFLSTTLDEQIAKTFCEYGNAAIIRIRTEQGLPHLYIEPLKEENQRNEEEILILPFSEIIEAEHTSEWKGYSYYDVKIKKGELPEIELEELKSLKTQCLSEFDSFQEYVKQYNSLEEQIERLNLISERATEKEDLAYIKEHKKEMMEQLFLICDKITEYKKKFTKMLKGSCRQKEKEIDNQREEILEQQKKEKEKKEDERVEKLKEEIEKLKIELRNQSKSLKNILDSNLKQLEGNANFYEELAKRIGVSYTQLPRYSLLEMVTSIKQELEKNKENQEQKVPDEEYTELLEEKAKLDSIESQLKTLPNLVSNHENQSMQEIKYNLNTQVRQMLKRTKYNQLQEERKQILMKRDSIFQRIRRKNSLKEEELKHIDAKVDLTTKDSETMNPENRIGVMLESIYECSYENLYGQFTPEMIDMISKIRNNFGNLPNEQELMRRVNQKATNQYPIPSKQKPPVFFRKRRMLEIKNQTRIVEEKLKQITQRKRRVNPIQVNIIEQMENKMSDIYNIIKQENYSQEEKEKNAFSYVEKE